MMQNEEQSKTTNIDMLLNDNLESNQRVKNLKSENTRKNSNNDNNNFDDISPRIRRSNSIKLYKRHKKEKELNNNIIKEKDLNNNIKKEKIQYIDLNNNDNIYDGPETCEQIKNNVSINKKRNNSKRVTFLEPNFVSIINVESYKKYNEENTCKDPFDDMEFLKNINNVNNYNINININNNNIKNKNKKEQQADNGKERINCSCACGIF